MRICLVCLKKVDEETSTSEETSGPPLLTKFLKFVQKYLQVSQLPSSEQLLGMSGGERGEVFCEKCELSVINPICQVYSQLVATQLRLSWELEQLEKLLITSQSFMTPDSVNNHQDDIKNDTQLKIFRLSLIENCHLKRINTLPEVLVQRLMIIPSPVTDLPATQAIQNFKTETRSLFEGYHDDDDFDPLDVDRSPSLHSQGHVDEYHTFENVTSPDRSNNDQEMEIDEEYNTVKIEIVQEAQQILIPTEELEETNDPTCQLHSPPVKMPEKETPVIGKKLTRERLRHHKYRVHVGMRFRCVLCNSCFKKRSLLEEHVSSIHNPQPEQPQTCLQCKKMYKNIKALKMHVYRFHPSPQRQNLYKCPKCGVSMHYKRRLNEHILDCTGVTTSSIKPPKVKRGVTTINFSCNDCSESFPTDHLLQQHIAEYHSQKVELAFGNITKILLEQKMKKKMMKKSS